MTAGAEYGRALFLLTEETGETEDAVKDIHTVETIMSTFPEYVRLLDTPAVTKAEKLALIDEAFAPVLECIRNLLKILSERHAVHIFGDAAKAYSLLYDEARGIEHAEAVTAVAMSEEQIRALEEKLSAITEKRIILKNTVEEDILGGVKLRFSGKQIDSSLKTRLDGFERSLKNTII